MGNCLVIREAEDNGTEPGEEDDFGTVMVICVRNSGKVSSEEGWKAGVGCRHSVQWWGETIVSVSNDIQFILNHTGLNAVVF